MKRQSAHPLLTKIRKSIKVGIPAPTSTIYEIDCDSQQNEKNVMLNEADILRYEQDGVVLLRGVLDVATVSRLQDAIARARSAPACTHPFRATMGEYGGWVDKFLWRDEERYPEYKALIYHAPLTGRVAALMRSPCLQLLYDHTCVKEAGDVGVTKWHHDINYLPVEPPDHFASAWVALDDVGDRQGQLEFVRGSHRWKTAEGMSQRFQPMDFPTMTAVDDNEWIHPESVGRPGGERKGFLPLPDVEASRAKFDIVTTSMKAGDALVFHGLALHYSGGNHHSKLPRRAISLRYCGENARYIPRRKQITSGWPLPLESLMESEDRLSPELFPLVFPACHMEQMSQRQAK